MWAWNPVKTGDVYLAAGSQSEASSQQQDDVPGHSLVNDLPAQQSGRSLHHLTCETQVRQKTINALCHTCWWPSIRTRSTETSDLPRCSRSCHTWAAERGWRRRAWTWRWRRFHLTQTWEKQHITRSSLSCPRKKPNNSELWQKLSTTFVINSWSRVLMFKLDVEKEKKLLFYYSENKTIYVQFVQSELFRKHKPCPA